MKSMFEELPPFASYAPFCLSELTKYGVTLVEFGDSKSALLPLGERVGTDWNRKSGDECEHAYQIRFMPGEYGAAAKRFARRFMKQRATRRDLVRLENAYARSLRYG